jgi:hypothetical protein
MGDEETTKEMKPEDYDGSLPVPMNKVRADAMVWQADFKTQEQQNKEAMTEILKLQADRGSLLEDIKDILKRENEQLEIFKKSKVGE